MIDLDLIRERFAVLSPHLDERERRLLAAVEARACGNGGIAAVSLATGIAASAIGRGLKDLARGVTSFRRVLKLPMSMLKGFASLMMLSLPNDKRPVPAAFSAACFIHATQRREATKSPASFRRRYPGATALNTKAH
jgi:hypothetical protein